MSLQSKTINARLLKAVALAAAVSLAGPVPASFADDGPFSALGGSWTGSGTLKTKTGNKERIRCKVGYDVSDAGDKFEQNMKCASDSYKFDVRADIAYADGVISGQWAATSYNLTGNITGSANSQKIQAKIRGDGLIVSVAVTTNDSNQSVTIQSEGTEISEVNIKLKKGAI
jgi:hypothetical protein